MQDIRHGRPHRLPSGEQAVQSSLKKRIPLMCGFAWRWFPQRDRAQDDVGPRVLWWVWEPLVAKTLTRGQTLLPALFERDAAAQAPFPSGSAPSRFRLSQVCPVAPGV